MSTFLYLQTNPFNLVNLLSIILLMCIMYFCCDRFKYVVSALIYAIFYTCFVPLFDAIMSSMMPWMNLGHSISFWDFVINFILGIILVKIFQMLKNDTQDAKLFVLLGSIAQILVEFLLYFILLLIF